MTFSLHLIAALLGGLVIDQRLPDVVYPPAVVPDERPNPPKVKNCRQGCKCTKADCQCGNVAAACTELAAAATLDESALRTIAAQAQEPTDTITVLTPAWCVGPCAWLKEQLGEGDALTKVEYVQKEAWWTLGPDESYPLMVDLKTLKKWSQDPRPGAKDVRPRTMDEARAKLGIMPKVKGHVAALTVGTLPKAQVDLVRMALGESGKRKQGKEPLTHDVTGGTAKVPARALVEWDTDERGVIALNFDKRPRVSLGGILTQDLARVVIGEKTVTLELPWAPDAVFRIVE
jgi:hypothetical protein